MVCQSQSAACIVHGAIEKYPLLIGFPDNNDRVDLRFGNAGCFEQFTEVAGEIAAALFFPAAVNNMHSKSSWYNGIARITSRGCCWFHRILFAGKSDCHDEKADCAAQ